MFETLQEDITFTESDLQVLYTSSGTILVHSSNDQRYLNKWCLNCCWGKFGECGILFCPNLNLTVAVSGFQERRELTWRAAWHSGWRSGSCYACWPQLKSPARCSQTLACRWWHRWRRAWQSAGKHKAKPEMTKPPSSYCDQGAIEVAGKNEVTIQKCEINFSEFKNLLSVKNYHINNKIVKIVNVYENCVFLFLA